MKQETLGGMIASLRREHGMTQAELAAKMNITDKAVSKWERDISCPDINSLPKLAELFGVSVDELMRVKRPPEGEEKPDVGRLVGLVCRAVTVAMGVAVVVLSALRKIDMYSACSLLGIGLTCAGVGLLTDGKTEKNER